MHLGLVLHGQGSDVSVGDEVASNASCREVLTKESEMVRAGIDGRDVGELEPLPHEVNSNLDMLGPLHESGTGHQSDETHGYDPR